MLYTTFSLTARCPRTGQFGVAVATRVPAVGAALQVVDREDYAFIDVRIDEHADPIPELHRVYAVWDEVFRPHLAARPTRADLGARAGSHRPQLVR